MLNVLQLCAGKGTRFKSMIDIPKPFIDVNGSPMFKSAIDSLGFKTARIHHLFQETHIKEYNPAQYVSEHHVIHTITIILTVRQQVRRVSCVIVNIDMNLG